VGGGCERETGGRDSGSMSKRSISISGSGGGSLGGWGGWPHFLRCLMSPDLEA